MGAVKEQPGGLWSGTDRKGMSVPIVDCGQDTTHFYGLSGKDRMAVSCWLLLNIRSVKTGKPAAYMTSWEVAELASFFTGIRLNSTQAREALLLLAIKPWDASGRDWVYRVDRESPCAMLAFDGNGGLVRTDRSCHVRTVGIPLSNR